MSDYMTPEVRAKIDRIETTLGETYQRSSALREALEEIVLHADMSAGESWEAAYAEVTSIARRALDSYDPR